MPNVIFDFTGQTALVTGATKGIGREIALALASAGCDIAATGRNERELAELKDRIEALGRRCDARPADLANAHEAIGMATYFCDRHPDLSLLINNAGVSFPEKLVDLGIDHWNATLDVNLRAPALISRVVARQMIGRGAGAIVHVASLSSVTGLAEHAAYCASKAGLVGLIKVMAIELGPHNIRVNGVGPTVVMTPMGKQVWGDPKKGDPMKAKIPLGRFAEPTEVVNAVLFLASDAASMISGELLLVDGGYMAQ